MVNAEHKISTPTIAGWLVAALAVFVVVGTVDWLVAWRSASASTLGGGFAAWAVFAGVWGLAGAIWAVVSAAGIWASSGVPSAVPLFDGAIGAARRWWRERGEETDRRRVANLVAAASGGLLFCGASIAVMTHLIEAHSVAWLIATAALILQVVVLGVAVTVGLSLRRGILWVLGVAHRRRGARWLSAPVLVMAMAAVTAVVVVAGIFRWTELFSALEGPAIVLGALAVALHLPVAWLVERYLPPPRWVRWGVWAMPVVAVAMAGVFSQHGEARLIVVLHGQAADFGFTALQRHAGLDSLFDRRDCPPVGPEGEPLDGTPWEDYESRCMSAAFDRPVARQEAPQVEVPEFDEPPSIVLITWDSVRIDRLSLMGHERDTTPHLDAFAEQGLVFERAFAADSGTGPSVWSMMAGKTPFQVNLGKADRFPPPIEEGEPMLGLMLEEAGYVNQAILCGTIFERDYWGIRWGFERFDNVCGRSRQRVAPLVTRAGVSALRSLVEGEEPFFLWVHYYDPHTPYTSHPEIGYGEGRLDRYDEELTYTDLHTRELLEAIEEVRESSGRPIFTIFSADHGENFDEHGSDPHARNLYRIVTHVPKIVDGPGVVPRRVAAPVALSDIYPSILDLAQVEIPEETTMISQMPVYFGAEPDEGRMVFQENSYSRPRRHTRAVVWGEHHYIMDLTTHTQELYDYVSDPIERENLVGRGLVEEQIMRQALVRFLRTTRLPEGMED